MLKVEDLHIQFSDQSGAEEAVAGISFAMDAGEILGIVGESGSGKTLSALTLAGLLPRQRAKAWGKVLFGGQDLLSLSPREMSALQGKDIAMVFQEPQSSLNPTRRIGWQMEEALKIHTSLPKEQRRQKVLAALEKVYIDDPVRVIRQYPHELSGGMRQRVMIAAAMLNAPKLLIADEPTTALDATTQGHILDLLMEINQTSGVAILFISHDLQVISRLCSRTIVMEAGRIVEQGQTKELFLHPQADYSKKLMAAGRREFL